MELISYTKKFNKVIYSIVALCLMVLLLFTATFAWLSKSMGASVNSSNEDDYITISADAGLEMNYGDQDMNEGTININQVVNDGFKLYECSSTDGRSFFFPLSGYDPTQRLDDNGIRVADQEFVEDANTNDFLYRPSTVNDKNNKYISVDLSLRANVDTPVWLSPDTKVEGAIADCIRIAFIENEPNGESVIFDNSKQGYGDEYTGISSIITTELRNDFGVVTHKVGSVNSTIKQSCNSIQSYTSDNEDNPLFRLTAGVEKKITVNIWLEGTDKDCTHEKLSNISDLLDIFIKFSTSTEDKVPYYFIDHTLEQWVDDADCYVFAFDATGNEHPMVKSDNYDEDHTWIVELNASKKPVQFARYNPDNSKGNPEEWNIWESGDPGSCKTYNAFAHNTGIWDDSFTGDTITFFDAMSEHTILDQSNGTEMLVNFTTTDGNGNDIEFVYKMSNQWDERRWRTVVPSDAQNITFKWCESSDTAGEAPWLYWENTERGTNTYFSALNYEGGGYWSDRVLLVDGADHIEDGVIWVAYFFDGDTPVAWTAMNGKTTGGRYMAGVPEGATSVIFCRYAEYSGYFDWECVYNKTYDLSITSQNMYKISGYDGDRYHLKGDWSTTSNID